MPRLPQPGGDQGNWGSILNEYLSASHKQDGTLKDNIVTANSIAPGAIDETNLSQSVQDKLDSVAGQQGFTGPIGPQGATGATGTPGTPGASGTPGQVGATGATGTPSTIPGATGATGPQGPQGIQGDPGPAATVGATGATGATGQIGATGAKGDQGDPGPAATVGATGPIGPQGPQGATGASGTPGTPGASGTPGTNGTQGATGASGTPGAVGATGASGATGTNGAIGATGASGPMGATGPAGASGSAGQVGATGASGTDAVGYGNTITIQGASSPRVNPLTNAAPPAGARVIWIVNDQNDVPLAWENGDLMFWPTALSGYQSANYVDSSFAKNSLNAASLDITLPSSIATNDMILVVTEALSQSAEHSVSGSYTSLGENARTGISSSVFWKIADASDASSTVTFTSTALVPLHVAVFVLRGPTGVATTSTANQGGGSTNINIPDYTTDIATIPLQIITLGSATNQEATITAPSGSTIFSSELPGPSGFRTGILLGGSLDPGAAVGNVYANTGTHFATTWLISVIAEVA